MQKLGQYFLKNTDVIEKIIAQCTDIKNETIIEIGSGRGALTIPLSKLCQKNSNHLIAIEKDKRLALDLFKQNLAYTTVKHADIRTFLPNFASQLHHPSSSPVTPPVFALENIAEKSTPPVLQSSNYNIVGNIPYYLTGFLLRIISELPHKPEKTILMVQKEVGERLASHPPRMNKLAACTGVWADTTKLAFVSKKDFTPSPQVDSIVVKLEKKPENNKIDLKKYFALVNILFQQPRKTIENNLKHALSKNPKINIQTLLSCAEIAPSLRPQNLSVKQIIKLAALLNN